MSRAVLSVSRISYVGGALPGLVSVRFDGGAILGVYVPDAEWAVEQLSLGRAVRSADGLLVLTARRHRGVIAARLRHGPDQAGETVTVGTVLVATASWERDLRRAGAVLGDARLALAQPAAS